TPDTVYYFDANIIDSHKANLHQVPYNDFFTCLKSNPTKNETKEDHPVKGNHHKPSQVKTSPGSLGVGAIIGIVSGALMLLCIVLLVIFCLCCKSPAKGDTWSKGGKQKMKGNSAADYGDGNFDDPG